MLSMGEGGSHLSPALERPFSVHNSQSEGHTGSGCVHVGLANRYDPNSSSNAFASFRSSVSKPFGEPAVDRSEKIAGLLHACPDRARAAPCSSPRAVPRTLLAAYARPRARARNTLPLSPHPAPATSARFPRRCDGSRLRTIFPWLFPSPSSLRQCSAKRHRIGRVPHRPRQI